MQLIRDYNNLPAIFRGAAIALGNFDGLHRGHQALISQTVTLAKLLKIPAAIMTFEPHPREFFSSRAAATSAVANSDAAASAVANSDAAASAVATSAVATAYDNSNDSSAQNFLKLMRLKEKLSQLRYMEIDFVYMLRFNSHLAEMPADKFASDILAKALSARYIITGDNFCFGAQRRGNSKFLTEIAAENGFSYRAVEEVKSEEIISSSAIRQALTNGDIGKAQSLLGRAHSICGHVISGEKRGRKLGFPTANLNMQKIFAPRHGVYAVDVAVETEQTIYSGVANIGIKPSFGKNKVSLEAHLFEYCGDLYGKYIKVRLKKFLRDEKKFNSLDELKKQIALDCQQAADHKLTN